MMFSEETHKVIERTFDRGYRAGVDLSAYNLIKFVVRKDYVEITEAKYGSSDYQLYTHADFVIGYKTVPSAKHVFELFEVDLPHSIVFEISKWCDENLSDYRRLIGEVTKSRVGMPRKFPIFEMNDDADAMAFKIRWM